LFFSPLLSEPRLLRRASSRNGLPLGTGQDPSGVCLATARQRGVRYGPTQTVERHGNEPICLSVMREDVPGPNRFRGGRPSRTGHVALAALDECIDAANPRHRAAPRDDDAVRATQPIMEGAKVGIAGASGQSFSEWPLRVSGLTHRPCIVEAGQSVSEKVR
jgi:hypothetical protein